MRRGVQVAASLAALALIGGGCGSSPKPGSPLGAPNVALNTLGSLGTLNLGVVVTEEPGAQGWQDLALAAGVQVARYRLSMATARVALHVADDMGTSDGSTSAVRQLLAEGVSGIVYASEGDHITAGVAEAASAGTAVLLPYETDPGGLPAGAWLTGPDNQEIDSTISEFIAHQNLGRSLVVADPGGAELDLVQQAPYKVTLSPGEAATQIEAAIGAELTSITGNHDPFSGSAIVLADSTTAADVVSDLERANVETAVVGPDALSPVFGNTLQSLASTQASSPGGATTEGNFYSVGVAASDAQVSAGMPSFLAALRLAAADTGETALGQPSLCFEAGGAATADTRSHDAVVALATAAARARSTKPSAILTTLDAGLTVDSVSGLSGPPLDFQAADALRQTGVSVLAATAEADSARQTFDQPCPNGTPAPLAYQSPVLQWFNLPSRG